MVELVESGDEVDDSELKVDSVVDDADDTLGVDIDSLELKVVLSEELIEAVSETELDDTYSLEDVDSELELEVDSEELDVCRC